MTFCFFSAQYLPTVGGVERYTWNLARRAAAAGHRAIVVTSALPGLPARETDADGIEVFRLPVWSVMKGRFPVLRPGRRFAALARELWAQKPDFCLIQTRMYVQSVWAAAAARRHGVRAAVLDHSTGYMPMGGGFLGLCGRLYEQLACRFIKRCGFDFYGVSAAVCDWLKTFGVAAKGCLPNAVDPAELAALADGASPADWRAELGLAPETKLVAFAGRLIPEKGAAALAQAVAGLPGTALVAAGAGPLLETLRAQAPANVFFPGSLPHEAALRLLTQADCYCLPTTYAEGFPTTLLEAAACRCPILCTRTAGTGELLPGNGYAVFLPDAAPESIRAGLQAVLNDRNAAKARADAAYQNLCTHFTWDAVFAMILSVAGAAP